MNQKKDQSIGRRKLISDMETNELAEKIFLQMIPECSGGGCKLSFNGAAIDAFSAAKEFLEYREDRQCQTIK